MVLNAFTSMNSSNSLYCNADERLASHATKSPIFSQAKSDLFAIVFFLQPFRGIPWGGNGPLWSLSYEFWYYLVFFSSVFILSSVLKSQFNWRLIFHFLILVYAFFLLDMEWLILGCIWLSGALASYILNDYSARLPCAKIRKLITLKFTLSTLIILIPVLLSLRFLPRLLAFPISVVCLTFLISIMQEKTHSVIDVRWQSLMVRGSEFSFSLYLIHFPVIALAAEFLTPINRREFSTVGFLILLGIIFFALLTAYAFAWVTEFNLAWVQSKLLSLTKIV